MRVPGPDLIACSRTSNLRGFVDLLGTWGAILLVIALAHAAGHTLAYAAAVPVLAGLQNRLTVLAHEAWHGKAFRPRRLNGLLGAWFYSYPVGTMFRVDQARHMAHHRLVGRPEDPDWSDYERSQFERPAGVVRFLIGQLLGGKVVLRVLGLEIKPATDFAAVREFASDGDEPNELVRILLCQGLLLAAFALFGHWWEYGVLWAIPLATFASFFVSLRALVEHFHPDHDVEPEARLADFAPNVFGRFFLSPGLFHLHALHHAYPGVPYYRKHVLMSALAANGATYPGRQRGGYLKSLLENLRALQPSPAEA